MTAPIRTELIHLQEQMMIYYHAYKRGTLTQAEYLNRIKPLDQAIDKAEMAILLDNPVLRKSS